MQDEFACLGAQTKPATLLSLDDAAECVACGTKVRWDLVDHPFFGFKERGSMCIHALRAKASGEAPKE